MQASTRDIVRRALRRVRYGRGMKLDGIRDRGLGIRPFIAPHVLIVGALLCPSALTEEASPRAVLIEARDLAYDANYRNDQAGLRSAIATLETLTNDPRDGAYAQYYLSWTYWALAGSQFQAKDADGALASGTKSLEHARLAIVGHEKDPEFQTALTNALIAVGVLGHRITDQAFMAELMAARRTALELGPDNPRAVLMDAGVVFNSPPEMGGSREAGLARGREALKLFDAESAARMADPVSPRWGGALAYGWLAGMYLAVTPPQQENARTAAETALRMRPDFWFVRDQVLPKLNP